MTTAQPGPRRFENQTVLVTGASRGIGAGIARRLAREGARVAITYSTNPEAANEVLKTLAALPSGATHLCLHMNIADENSVQAGFDTCLKEFGKLDGLVNNAGITRDQLLMRMKSEDFDAVINTNLKGAFLCTRAAVKSMVRARLGSIVTITSVIGEMGNAGQANYAASKAGAEAFSKSIAKEVASRNVRLNCVAPGFVVTEMTDILTDEQKTAILARVPLGCLGEVEDVAAATAFLLSQDAKYITGHTLSVNGGLYI